MEGEEQGQRGQGAWEVTPGKPGSVASCRGGPRPGLYQALHVTPSLGLPFLSPECPGDPIIGKQKLVITTFFSIKKKKPLLSVEGRPEGGGCRGLPTPAWTDCFSAVPTWATSSPSSLQMPRTHCPALSLSGLQPSPEGGRLTQASLPRGRLSPSSSPSAHSPCCAWEWAVGPSTSQAGPGCCCCSELRVTQGKIKQLEKEKPRPRPREQTQACDQGHPSLSALPRTLQGRQLAGSRKAALGLPCRPWLRPPGCSRFPKRPPAPAWSPAGVRLAQQPAQSTQQGLRWQPGPFQPEQHSYRLWSPGRDFTSTKAPIGKELGSHSIAGGK